MVRIRTELILQGFRNIQNKIMKFISKSKKIGIKQIESCFNGIKNHYKIVDLEIEASSLQASQAKSTFNKLVMVISSN